MSCVTKCDVSKLLQHPEVVQDFLKFRSDMEKQVSALCTVYASNIAELTHDCYICHHLVIMYIYFIRLQGMFKTDPWFFVTQFAHVIVLHFTAWWVLWNFGNNWLTWLVSVCMVVISQAQVGWLQHDFGHLSVFNSTRLNHLVHYITMGLMKVCTYGKCSSPTHLLL